MELTPIGNEKLEIALTRKDMERFHLTAERLDYKNTETRRAVWTILDTAKRKTGFDAAAGKIRIDALPSKAGGCVIFITKTDDTTDTEDIMGISKEKALTSVQRASKAIYRFTSLADLLHVCLFLSAREYAGESAAFAEICDQKGNNRYYLTLSDISSKDKNPCGVFENMFICEFGKKISEEHAILYIKEHCKCFCPESAVNILADMA